MHLYLEQTIEAPPDDVWQVLGAEFADIAHWASFVKTSRAIEDNEVPSSMSVAPTAPVLGRETVTKAKLIEVVTAYSDEQRSLTFDVAGLPRIVKRAIDTQTVTATGPTSCVVSFEVDFELIRPFALFDPILKRRMSTTFSGVLADLKQHLESSTRHSTGGE